MPEQKIYRAKQIFTGHEWLRDHAVITEDGQVTALTPLAELPGDSGISYETILPAFIDLQIYGAQGKLFSVYPEVKTLEAIHQYCKQGGAYWFQPTVATNTPDVFRKCIDAVRMYWKKGGAGCLGLHLEGPWLSADKKGAHIKVLIHKPSLDEVMDLLECGKGVIKMITLAPEVCSDEVIGYVREQGIVISAGHSNATYAEATSAFDNGIRCVTHLYNAMSALQHREPGLVGATLLHKNAMASIIADGHHVDWPAIRIAKEMMKDRLFLITDAVTETTEGAYQHQAQGDKYVASGILSGSALTMMQAARNLIDHCGIDKTEALKMACVYPALALGMEDSIGMIKPGMTAHFIATDEKLDVVQVIF